MDVLQSMWNGPDHCWSLLEFLDLRVQYKNSLKIIATEKHRTFLTEEHENRRRKSESFFSYYFAHHIFNLVLVLVFFFLHIQLFYRQVFWLRRPATDVADILELWQNIHIVNSRSFFLIHIAPSHWYSPLHWRYKLSLWNLNMESKLKFDLLVWF